MSKTRAASAVALLALIASCKGKPTPPAPRPAPSPTATATASAAARALPAGKPDAPRLALGVGGAVTSHERHASQVGLEVLKQGGNAVDAAVAVAFALAVTHPSAGNLGGGGFMVVRLADGRSRAFDFRETAPGKASRNMYLDAKGKPTGDSLVGPKAAGIPGSVAGLALAHRRLGTRPWRELVLPAVKLARDGHVLDRHHAGDLAYGRAKMKEAKLDPSIYQRADGSAFEPGDTWKQPELGDTLEAVAGGPEAFYQGPVARRLVEGVAKAGGIWQLADLASYRAVEREPIVVDYRGHQLVTMPLPSSGGVVLAQLFFARELYGVYRQPWLSAAELHLYVESTRRAYADRNMLLGDPDVVEVPVPKLLSRDYLRSRMAGIGERATPSSQVSAGLPAPSQSEETTHFSVIDRWGNAVSLTTTLNTGFGSKFVVPGTGVLLNNEMDDFSVKPGTANVYGLVQSEPNAIAPGKRMLSSMTPTIVVKDGQVRAVVGSPGGPTIITTVAQIIRSLIDYDKPIDIAVAAPRVHHQWLPDKVFVEKELPAGAARGLEARGHVVQVRPAIGHANCIEVDPQTHGFRAVADTERDGGAAVAY